MFSIKQVILKLAKVRMNNILAANASASSASLPQANTKNFEKEIDQLVYKLYDLTEEEIKIIERVE